MELVTEVQMGAVLTADKPALHAVRVNVVRLDGAGFSVCELFAYTAYICCTKKEYTF